MGVAGLGDRSLNPRGSPGVFPGHEADVGADRGVGEARPVPISTVNASPVRAEMPRKQPSRLTGSANRGEAATPVRPSRPVVRGLRRCKCLTPKV